jgi:hypothetical protein
MKRVGTFSASLSIGLLLGDLFARHSSIVECLKITLNAGRYNVILATNIATLPSIIYQVKNPLVFSGSTKL